MDLWRSRFILLAASALILFLGFSVFAGNNETKAMPKRSIYMPYNIFAVKNTIDDTKTFKCVIAPQPIIDLELPAYYDQNDDSRSRVNKEIYDQHQEMREPLRYYERRILYMANRYVEGGMKRHDIAKCTADWLYEWADTGAMLGQMNKTGEQVQKWALSVFSNAYYQIMYTPSISDKQKDIIESWLREYAYAVKEKYSSNKKLPSRQNNHIYWAAWSVGVTGAVLEDKTLYLWGIDNAKNGLDQIGKNGDLPLEMKRGNRALNYHIFAAHPLVMLAELSRQNKGDDLYAYNDGALNRLVETSLKGLKNPSYFNVKSGKKQKVSLSLNRSALAWLEVYTKTQKNSDAEEFLEKYRPMKQTRTGGNITMLYSGTEFKELKASDNLKTND